MQVADLQKFVRNQAQLLSAVGAKTVANDFERLAAGMAPFEAQSVAQFVEFLAQAETYHRTGAVGTSGKGARKKSAPPVDSTQKIREAAQRVAALYERALDPDLQYAAIDQAIQTLGKSLSKDEAVQVAREVGVQQALKTKKAALEQMGRMISERKESHARTSQIGREPALATGSPG